MKKHQMTYEEMERKLAESEAKNSSLQNTIQKLNVKVTKVSEEKEESQKEIENLKAFIKNFREKFDVERMYTWAKGSERFSKEELKDLLKLLKENEVKPKDIPNQDIAEAGNWDKATTTIATDNNDDLSSTEDIVWDVLPDGITKEDLDQAIKEKKKRGRQEGVKTCGRDSSVYDKLDSIEIVVDDLEKLKEEYPDRTFELSGYRMVKKIDYVKAHARTRIVKICIYKDNQFGELHESQHNNPQDNDFFATGKLTNKFIASVITDKIIFGSPLNLLANKLQLVHQDKIVDVQLLSSNFMRVAEGLTELSELIRQNILNQKCFHADESKLKVIDYKNKDNPGSKLGYMWSLSCNTEDLKAAFFLYNTSRSTEIASSLLKGATNGGLQVDGYSAYKKAIDLENEKLIAIIKKEDGEEAAEEFRTSIVSGGLKGLTIIGCLAHARRKIYKILQGVYAKRKDSPGYFTTSVFIAIIGKIYEIERKLRKDKDEGRISAEEFVKLRKEQALPLFETLKKYCEERTVLHKKETKLKEALNYYLNHHAKIINYLDYADLTPDNNFQLCSDFHYVQVFQNYSIESFNELVA